MVGGRALIVPERATARTVSVKKTSREVTLERYGGDLEMNLNLMHEPSMFKQELDLKIRAQQRELERVLIEIGYDTLLEGGMRLETAILRSSAAFNATIDGGGDGMGATTMGLTAARIYNSKCFGVMNKHKYPMHAILSAAKYASAYSIGQPGSMMILPHGMPELLRYGRPEAMVFNINGLKTTDNKPITMELGTAHTDPATSIKMMTHIPLPTYEYGTGNPRVGLGCLSEVVDVYTWYLLPSTNGGAGLGLPGADYTFRTVNAKTKTTTETNGRAIPANEALLCIRKTRVAMSSAILAAPGADTGELLVGMPHTGISTSQTDETMKMQLRVYLGAVLKRPESVIILPHVVCDGLVHQTVLAPPAAAGAGAVIGGVGVPVNLDLNGGAGAGAARRAAAQAFEEWTENDDAPHDFVIRLGNGGAAAGQRVNYAGVAGVPDRALPLSKNDIVDAGDALPTGSDIAMAFEDDDIRTWDQLKANPQSFSFLNQMVSPAAFSLEVAPGNAANYKIKNSGHFGVMEDVDRPDRIGALDGEFNDLLMTERGRGNDD